MNDLIRFFPRDFGLPARFLVNNYTEFFKYINRYNGLKNIYYSIYDCETKVDCKCHKALGETHFCNTKLDKIAFDCDSINSFNIIKRFVFHPETKNIKKLIISSGDKSHIYIFTKNYDKIKNKSNCLKLATQHIIKILGLKVYNDSNNDDIDFHLIGDISRILRIPNTLHLTKRRFYIPIDLSDIKKGKEFIIEKSKKQNFTFSYIGSELFDIGSFDLNEKNNNIQVISDYDYNFNINDDIIDDFLPCIKRILLEKGIDNFYGRYVFAVYCSEIGMPQNLCDKIAKKYFSKTKRTDRLDNNYEHFRRFKTLYYSYTRGDFFPTCNLLFEKGICVGKCKFYGRGVYK